MNSELPAVVTILAASPSAAEREALLALIKAADDSAAFWLLSSVVEAASASRAEKLLDEGGISLCIAGAALGEAQQEQLIRSAAKKLSTDSPIVIAVLERGDQATLMRFIQAGARGILLAPVSPEAFQQVLASALDIRTTGKTAPEKAAAAGLPYVLAHVAQRLTELAERIRDEETSSPTAANAKLIKEALLGVIGTSTSEQDDSLLKLAEYLARQSVTSTS